MENLIPEVIFNGFPTMIIEYIIFFLFSFCLTYLLVPLNIRFSRKFNLIDVPHERGIHKKEIPLAGGFSFAIPIILLQLVFIFKYQELSFHMLKLAVGSFFILTLGYLDDKRKFTANYKLLFQILIIIAMYYWGFRIELLTNPFGADFKLGILSFPTTIIWFLLVINAFNLIDGIDGLASGIAIIVSAVLLAMGIIKTNGTVILLSIVLIGSNLAFLRYNFYPAKIFMGDTGSLFIGFNIAAISIIGTSQYKGFIAMTLLIPLTALIIPISDTFTSILRRLKRKENIFKPDKEHLHHKMLKLGFSQKAIALISYFITFTFGLIALGFSLIDKRVLFSLLIILGILVLIIIYYIIKKEFFK